MSKEFSDGNSLDAESLVRAVRHPHVPGMWCYRQHDVVYEQLQVGLLSFAEGGSAVCAVADIVDVKPDKILAFLQDEGYVTDEAGVTPEGIVAAVEQFGGSVVSAGTVGLGTPLGSEDVAALREHLVQGMPAIVYLDDASDGRTAVAVAGYDVLRDEMLLFDPRGAQRDGWYPWGWVADKMAGFVLAVRPEEDRYTPRSIFKQIYGIDIAGHEQRWPDIDLAVLKNINPECLGWVRLAGTALTYPVLREHLDESYYQTHNFSGEPSIHGAVTLSFANSGSFEGPNLIFSAHRMRDYSMFKMLTFYDRPDFSAEHPFVDLLLGTQHYWARVFSAYHFPKRTSDAFRTDFADQADFECWFRRRIELSMHPFPAPSQVGKMATFRTCYGMANDETFVVHALLEPATD